MLGVLGNTKFVAIMWTKIHSTQCAPLLQIASSLVCRKELAKTRVWLREVCPRHWGPLVTQLYAYFFFFTMLWGNPVCSQASYAKGTSTKLLPCSTLTSSVDPPLLSQSPHFWELLPPHPSVPPSPFPSPFLLCYLQYCKPLEQWAELRNPPNSVIRAATQHDSHSTQHVHCFPHWFFDLFCGLLSCSILCSHSLTSQNSLFWD